MSLGVKGFIFILTMCTVPQNLLGARLHSFVEFMEGFVPMLKRWFFIHFS